MALIAAHLGVVDEDLIDNMSFLFFEDVLKELGHRLNYEAIVNYAGNSFCQKSWDMITENNPFNVSDDNKTNKKTMNSLAEFFASADITIKKKDKGKGENNGQG